MNVTLLRDLPTEYWWSMERYADELSHGLGNMGVDAHPYVAARPLPHLTGAANTFANYLWRSLAYPLAAHNHQGTVNHILDQSYAHLLIALDARRTVVTCHDIAPLALNEGQGISRHLWNWSFQAMQRAAHIIADSEFTRAEILRLSNYPTERITVVPLAVGTDFFEPVADSDVETRRTRYNLAGHKIILHVGACAPRKNVDLILRALPRLRDLGIKFVQLGGTWSADQNKLIDELGMRDVVLQCPPAFGYALRVWYHTANVFVFPSHYEGFGMPVIEAMACGTPVVCASTSSLPQIAGNSARLVSPDDPPQLAGAIREILCNPQLAAHWRAIGLKRAQTFSWERTARETFAVYEKIIYQHSTI